MYDFELPRECRDFAELCTDQAAYTNAMFPPEARNIVHRPLHRKLDAAISTMFHVNEPKRASMDIDAREQIFPSTRSCSANTPITVAIARSPVFPRGRLRIQDDNFSSKKISLPLLVSEMKYPPPFRLEVCAD